MITHEEARKSIGNIDYLSCHLMADYIAQQEKKDELLGLYRNLSMETDPFGRGKYWKQINKIEWEELE